jgi:Uma2 family endonuclease
MSTDWLSASPSPTVIGEPAWDIARLYPPQGGWSEDDYLSVALHEKWLIEYTDGCIEVLPMPTIEHQLILKFLLKALEAFTEPQNLGVVLFAPLPVKTFARKYREPDLIFNFAENHAKQGRDFYVSADLVMEVVSKDKQSRERDYEKKREDYAEAGIREYWIVDPQEARVTVLALDGKQYAVHCACGMGSQATSKLLDGFAVSVDALFAAGKA